MAIPVNTVQARECLIDAMKAKLVALLTGSPGMGKSSLMLAIAEEFNLCPIDVRLDQYDQCDLLGFPDINREEGKARYVPMDTFPIEGDEIPAGYDGWMIFLDEFPPRDKGVQKAAYRLILDRAVGNKKLHDKVVIVAAGNLVTDNALVEEMSTALQSRLIHYELMVDHEVWLEWAVQNNIHHYITDYIRQFPHKLFTFKPDHTDKTYCCGRTWEFASRFLHQRGHNLNDHILRVNLSGAISEGEAREFLAYCKVYGQLPTREAIISSPQTVSLPEERSILWALTGSIANWAKEAIMEPLLEYLSRFPMELQVICLREMMKRNPNISKHPAILDWYTTNSVDIW